MMPILTKEKRTESRAICNAATPGGWEHQFPNNGYVILDDGTEIAVVGTPEDAAFIAHARTALPAALGDLDEMEKDRDHWKARAESLERVLYGECSTCTKYEASGRLCANAYKKMQKERACWEFDQKKFNGKPTT